MKAARLERARQGVLNFTRYTMATYEVNWHHRVIASHLNQVTDGVITRLMIMCPPRAGKTELIKRLVAYYLGRNPDHAVIYASYAASLAAKTNREIQRILDTPQYAEVFPEVGLNSKNIRSVAGSWLRNSDEFEIVGRKGLFRSSGVAGTMTGYGLNLGIIDDPIKNREEANSAVYREKIWDWYTSTFFTRLEKNARVVVVMCLTGDTLVRMADGAEKPLADVRPGDRVATYEGGQIEASTIVNWKNQGPDFVYRVKTSSGAAVKANERHPFLVCREGELQWVRVRDLQVGDLMMRPGAPGKASPAPTTAATGQSAAKASAQSITSAPETKLGSTPHRTTPWPGGEDASRIATASTSKTMTSSWPSRAAYAPSAESPPSPASTCLSTGQESSASTTTTKPAGFAASSAMNATSSSDILAPKKCCWRQSLICDPIVEIEALGVEEVYDIQVDRTENFIANGFCSHNTRWHEDDLCGRLLSRSKADEGTDQWTVVSLPGIAEDPRSPFDPRAEGEPLWPAKYNLKRMNQIMHTIGSRDWASLYQQRPAPAEGDIVLRGWWRYYKELPGQFDQVAIAADLNVKEGEESDFTVMLVMGRVGGNFYVLDMVRARMGWTTQKKALPLLRNKWPDVTDIFIEDAANGAALVDEVKDTIPGVVAVRAKGSKTSRLQAVAAMIEAGNVYLPDPLEGGTRWVSQLVDEVTVFPQGKNDDMVDALVLGLSAMRQRTFDWSFSVDGVNKESLWL